MKRNGLFTAMTIAAICALALAGCGGSTANNPPAGGGNAPAGNAGTGAPQGGQAAAVNVEALYKANCVSCHGDNLEGKLGGNTNLQKVGSRRTADQIAAQIANGGNGMMGFKGKLKDNEINALAEWLATKK